MARIRSDKPEAYQSETLAEISLAAERTFKGMATIADDSGRLADKPAQINGELWSMRGSHTRDDLEAELDEMVKVDLVCRYTGCDGKRYLHLVKWKTHQKIDRPSKSRLPRCPHHHLTEDACGKHDGECKTPDSSMQTRETSRGLDADSRDLASDSMQDLGSLDLGSLDLGSSNPAPPDAAKPRQRAKAADDPERTKHAGDVVAAFVEGAVTSGQEEPASTLKARVGRDARKLMSEGRTAETLIDAARRMGAGEYLDLAMQLRKDSAAKTGNGSNGNGLKRGHTPYQNPADDSAYEEPI